MNRHYCFSTIGVGRHALGTPSRCAFLQTSGASLTTSVAGESQTLRRKGTQFRTRLLMLNTSSRRYTSSICFDRPFYGRKVAQFFASQRPIGLEGLVLAAPATPTPQNIPEPAKHAQLHAYDNRENALQALAFLTAFPPSDALREQILSDNFAGSPQAKLAWPTSSAYENISAVVGHIAVPTLILAGDQDRRDPLEQHGREVLPRIPGAKITVIRDGGHLLPIDQPIQLADAIRNFVFTLSAR